MAANDFEVQKTYLQLSKKIAELEKGQSAPDCVGDPKSWTIGAAWGLRLALSWIQNNTLVDLPEEVKFFQEAVKK